MIGAHECSAGRRDVLKANDLEMRIWKKLGPGERAKELLNFPWAELDNTFGFIQVADGPSLQDREHGEAGVGVHGVRAADGIEKRTVEVAVGVCRRPTHGYAVRLRPGANGGELAAAPDELSIEFAGVGLAIVVPSTGDYVLNTEASGDGEDKMFRGRRRDNDEISIRHMLVYYYARIRLKKAEELIGDVFGGVRDGFNTPAVRCSDREFGELHAELRFANEFEGLEDRASQWDFSIRTEAAFAEMTLDCRTGPSREQGPVEIEDRGS